MKFDSRFNIPEIRYIDTVMLNDTTFIDVVSVDGVVKTHLMEKRHNPDKDGVVVYESTFSSDGCQVEVVKGHFALKQKKDET